MSKALADVDVRDAWHAQRTHLGSAQLEDTRRRTILIPQTFSIKRFQNKRSLTAGALRPDVLSKSPLEPPLCTCDLEVSTAGKTRACQGFAGSCEVPEASRSGRRSDVLPLKDEDQDTSR